MHYNIYILITFFLFIKELFLDEVVVNVLGFIVDIKELIDSFEKNLLEFNDFSLFILLLFHNLCSPIYFFVSFK